MRRYTFLLIIMLSAFSVPAQEDIPRSIHWERIYSWKNKTAKAYIDTKSVRTHTENNKEYKIGMILFYRNNSVEISANNEKIVANIFASYYAADCERYKLATLSDFYFNLDRLPVSTDQPLVAFDYTDNVQDVVELEKTDPILTALCPTYI